MAGDGAVGGVIWWGGPRGDNQTWSYSGGRWANLTSALGTSPPAAADAALSDDPVDDRIVWVGGSANGTLLTWAFGSGVWTNLSASAGTAPSTRSGEAVAYDRTSGAVVLFGGWSGSSFLNDTWTFSAGGWSPLATVHAPAGRAGAGLAFDALDGYLVLLGGTHATGPLVDAAKFAAGDWTPLPAPPLGAGGSDGLASAPGGGIDLLGGTGCALPTAGPCNATFTYAGGVWSDLGASSGPSPRLGFALTYDPADGYVLGWGGSYAGVGFNDTWVLGGPLTATASAEPPVSSIGDELVDPLLTVWASGGYGAYTYAWSNGPLDCPFNDSPVIVCVTDHPATYNVTVQVTTGSGNVTTALVTFTVEAEFKLAVTTSVPIIDLGSNVTIGTAIVGGTAAVNFSWSGLPPGCAPVDAPSIECVPAGVGFFAPTVVAIDTLGDVAPSQPGALLVNPAPVIAIVPSRVSAVAPAAITLTPVVTGGSAPFTLVWSFGDGSTTTTAGGTVTHTYAAGSFSPGVTLTDAVGGRASASVAVNLTAPFVVQIVTTDASISMGTAWTGSAAGLGGVTPYTFTWTFGDGTTLNGPNASHRFAGPGSFDVVVVARDAAGLTAANATTVTVTSSGGGAADTVTLDLVVAAVVGGLVGAAVVLVARGPRRRRPERSAEGPPAESDAR